MPHYAATLLLTSALSAALPPQGLKLEYVANLATPAGEIRASAVRLAWDPLGRELYAVGYGLVRVFNEAAMETFRFGDDEALGIVQGVVALDGGDLLLLTSRDGRSQLVRCSFRGEVLEKVALAGLPAALAEGFNPDAIAYAKGRVYLADQKEMKVALVEPGGRYLASYDIGEMLELKGKQDIGMSGFNVDADGSLLFTVPPLFRAFLVTLQGQVTAFGKAGSAPGNFGVVSGVARDAAGRFYVVDTLKCVVIVFDADLRFQGEFGYRGRKPGELIAPTSIAVGQKRVYVSQNGDRGVAVYRINER